MQLVDEGLLDLDVPVREYLPGFRVADPTATRTVTPRHFLSHTSGIEGDLFTDTGCGDDSIARLQDMGTMLPSLFPPGERLSYCNFGFAMLGRVTEVLTGQTWDQVMRERLFEPLGMEHALTKPEETLRYRAAIGHIPDGRAQDGHRISPMPWLSHGQKAAGATPMMSAADLLKFAVMHIERGRNRTGNRLVSAASIREMQKPQFKIRGTFARSLQGWGLGWMLMRWSGKRIVGHDGGTVGQYAFLRVLPEEDLAIALLTNGGDAGGLYEELYRTLLKGLARVEMPEVPEIDETLNERLADDLSRYTGRYQNMAGITEISARAGSLTMEVMPTGIAGAPLPKSPLKLVDRNAARLATGNPALDRNLIVFNDPDEDPVSSLMNGVRMSRRIS
jgi:CubicO group peptidase (beta-lactamase class C family)